MDFKAPKLGKVSSGGWLLKLKLKLSIFLLRKLGLLTLWKAGWLQQAGAHAKPRLICNNQSDPRSNNLMQIHEI